MDSSPLKYSFALMMCITTLSATSQLIIPKGTKQIGGDVYASYHNTTTSYSNYKNYNFSVNPGISWFLTKNFSVGIKGSLSTSFSHKESWTVLSTGSLQRVESNAQSTVFSLGPRLRYYHKTGLFAEGLFLFQDYLKIGKDEFRTSYFLGIGYCKFLNSSVALEPIIRYAHYENSKLSKPDRDVSIQFGLGLSVYFFKKENTTDIEK